jgi:predicted DCC family thiol-disulfide oxidoreductase YuxK
VAAELGETCQGSARPPHGSVPSCTDTRRVATIVLFDGVCDLCNGTVRFILRRDEQSRFLFASLQSTAGRALLDQHAAAASLPDSVVVIEDGAVLTRSDAAIHILRGLGGVWRLMAMLGRLVPRPVRDSGYDLIARHRHRFFRGPARCLNPRPERAGQSLDRQ